MNKLKTMAAVLLPLMLVTFFLFLLSGQGYFSARVNWPADGTETGGTEGTTPAFSAPISPSASSPDAEKTEAPPAPSSSEPVISDSPNTTPSRPAVTTEKEDEDDSVPVFGPGGDFDYVTEFDGAGVIELPEKDETSDTGNAFVTEFPDTLPITVPSAEPSEDGKREEMRAVYVATVYNLDFPSAGGLSAASLKKELEALVDAAASQNLNTIIFQVRPASDAFYQSEIFPTSRFLTGKQGDPLVLDPLAYLIRIAHAKDIAVHAWINPYRVTLPNEPLSSLSPDNPAVRHPEWTYSVGGQIYYDPSLPAVRALVAEGIAELLTNYNLDGVMFDDYFYPSDIGLADLARYEEYREDGGALSLADWRRENVNQLIELSYRTVKEHRPDCLFGVAPRGIWRNASDDPAGSDTAGGSAYDEIYCDALAWVKAGWLDYLSPQIYWSFSHSKAPFGVLADWWNEALAGSGIDLVVSLAGYSLPESEIAAQKVYLSALSSYGGYAFYSYSYLR